MEMNISSLPDIGSCRLADQQIYVRNLKQETSQRSRPKSLEMSVRHASPATNDGCVFYRHSADLSDTTLAWWLLGIKRSKKITSNKLRKSKISCGRVDGVIMRPLTWGPNGTKFSEMVNIFTGSQISFSDDSNTNSPLMDSSSLIDDVANNNVHQITAKDRISVESFSSLNDYCTFCNDSSLSRENDAVYLNETKDIVKSNSPTLETPEVDFMIDSKVDEDEPITQRIYDRNDDCIAARSVVDELLRQVIQNEKQEQFEQNLITSQNDSSTDENGEREADNIIQNILRNIIEDVVEQTDQNNQDLEDKLREIQDFASNLIAEVVKCAQQELDKPVEGIATVLQIEGEASEKCYSYEDELIDEDATNEDCNKQVTVGENYDEDDCEEKNSNDEDRNENNYDDENLAEKDYDDEDLGENNYEDEDFGENDYDQESIDSKVFVDENHADEVCDDKVCISEKYYDEDYDEKASDDENYENNFFDEENHADELHDKECNKEGHDSTLDDHMNLDYEYQTVGDEGLRNDHNNCFVDLEEDCTDQDDYDIEDQVPFDNDDNESDNSSSRTSSLSSVSSANNSNSFIIVISENGTNGDHDLCDINSNDDLDNKEIEPTKINEDSLLLIQNADPSSSSFSESEITSSDDSRSSDSVSERHSYCSTSSIDEHSHFHESLPVSEAPSGINSTNDATELKGDVVQCSPVYYNTIVFEDESEELTREGQRRSMNEDGMSCQPSEREASDEYDRCFNISDFFDATFTFEPSSSVSWDDEEVDDFIDDVTIVENEVIEDLSNGSEFQKEIVRGHVGGFDNDKPVNTCANSKDEHVPLGLNYDVIMTSGMPLIVTGKPVHDIAEKESCNSLLSANSSLAMFGSVVKRNDNSKPNFSNETDPIRTVVVNNNRVQLRKISPTAGNMVNRVKLDAKQGENIVQSSQQLDKLEKNEEYVKPNVVVITQPLKNHKITDSAIDGKTVEPPGNLDSKKSPPLKRPTFLFCNKSPHRFVRSRTLDFLKDLSPSNLTPSKENPPIADVFSVATEEVLEGNKLLSRQESFTKCPRPFRNRRRESLDDVIEFEAPRAQTQENKDSDVESAVEVDGVKPRSKGLTEEATELKCHCYRRSVSSSALLKTRSLPMRHKPDYHSYKDLKSPNGALDEELKLDSTTTTPTAGPWPVDGFLRVVDDRRRRDSALSRGSATSSGTVVATDESSDSSSESNDKNGGLRPTPKKIHKPSSSADAVFYTRDATDDAKIAKKTYLMSRSQSLDRQHSSSQTMQIIRKYTLPTIHQPRCGMMLSAPTITVTHDCSRRFSNDVMNFEPMMSSSQSLASSSYLADESDALGSSSRGSSPPSSPVGSPRSGKTIKSRYKSKGLWSRDTKYAERQAAEACEWLRAAGFPQYAHLYEVGSFPVDLSSVGIDHDFLGQELIAALVRRLNILNKCASLKLDKTSESSERHKRAYNAEMMYHKKALYNNCCRKKVNFWRSHDQLDYMNYRYTFENILFEIMPLTATSIPSRLLHNRRSCEGAVCRNSNGKPEYDINHRSIHSDPGVCFDALSRKSDSSLISNKIMKKLEEGLQNVVMRQKHKAIENLYRLSPCFNDSQLGHDQYTPSRCGYSFKDQKLCRLDANDFSLPIERRNNNNRKAYVVDAKICDHKLCGQGRVKSTSLSSSATSLYSEEDDFIRSSVNASPVPSMTSECPSVASESLLPSYCSFLEENDKIFGHNFNQSSATVTQQTERCINNNNKTPEQRIAEINQKVLVNFCDNNREHNFDESSESTETDTYTCVLPSVPEEDSEEERSTQSREALTDQEEEELEQCALSEFWHLEEDGHRWSRLDSKASALETPSSRLSLHDQQESGESVSDVFPVDGYMRSDDSRRQWLTRGDDSLKPPNRTNLKPKHSFLKRVGGDLKKFSSFRKKEFHQRNNSIDGSIDTELLKPIKSRHDARNKSWRKRKVVIGEPTLQSGHERLDQMRCVPIDGSGIKDLQNQHRGRKNSSHSLISSSSSSGGASIASTPASRTRAFTEDFSSDMGEISPGLHGRNRALLEMNIHDNSSLRNKEPQPERDSFFVMPPGYKPGTFPSDLRERTEQDELTTAFSSPSSTSSTRSHSTSDSIQVTSDTKKSSRPMSVYDNLPEAAFNGNTSAQDIINILDPGSPFGVVDDSGVYDGSIESLEVPSQGIDNAFWSVDDIVEHTQSLQQMVGAWDEDTSDEKSDVAETRSTDSNLNAGEVLPSYSSENVSTTEDDAETQVLSGEQRPQSCLRWESLRRTSFGVSDIDESLQLHNLSVGQLMILRRLSVLKLTALMESYAFSNSKGALNWSVPRFIKRIKVPDYKEKSVFGVPLLHNVQRFGQPLPLCIQHALAYLRRTAMDQVGLFRKPGVKSRIQLLSEKCETNPDWSNFDDCSAYDVGDMVKKYFRDLPDPLMTMKMSDTFIGIFLYVPDELRLKAVQAAIMLLPDETRETLKTLLAFLSDFASFSSENHMNSSNLATCFAPSLFYQQFTSARLVNTSSSPKIRKSQGGKNLSMSLGRPEMREMHDNKAANLCLAFMINHVKDLFMISEDAMTQCRMSVMQQPEDVLASEIGYASDFQDEEFLADYHLYVDRMVAQMLREEQRISQNKGGWQNVVSSNGTELLCKKINDGNPLRLWRSKVEVTGSDPHQIMERILNERHLWDDDLIQWKVLQQPDERTQLYQTVRSEMSPHPTRDYCVLRSWRNGVTSRGGVSVIETSTGQQTLLGDVRGVVLTSRYLIEPTDVANKCTITHMCRVDTKGRNPEWYNKAYGHVITQQLLNIGESLVTSPSKLTSTSS